MDGSFDFEGKKIDYQISDDEKAGIKVVKGIEKMSRYITFYDSSGHNLGIRNVYDKAEDLQNITTQQALLWYKELLDNETGV